TAYRGPFLEGVRFEDAPELEEWVGAQRAYWQGQVEHVLGRLATLQLARRAFTEAAATARRWLGLNALSEPASRALMRALAGAGGGGERRRAEGRVGGAAGGGGGVRRGGGAGGGGRLPYQRGVAAGGPRRARGPAPGALVAAVGRTGVAQSKAE